MIFETERLYVTEWKEGDLEALYELFNDPAIKETIHPRLTIEETTHIFESQLQDYTVFPPYGRYFIIERSGSNFVGLFLLKEDKNKTGIEIGYSLKKEHWNKGYATEIVQESIHWLTAQKKFSYIYAITETDNINSQHVLLKNGFIQKQNFMEDQKEMSLFEREI